MSQLWSLCMQTWVCCCYTWSRQLQSRLRCCGRALNCCKLSNNLAILLLMLFLYSLNLQASENTQRELAQYYTYHIAHYSWWYWSSASASEIWGAIYKTNTLVPLGRGVKAVSAIIKGYAHVSYILLHISSHLIPSTSEAYSFYHPWDPASSAVILQSE